MNQETVSNFLRSMQPWQDACTFADVVWGDRINKTKNDRLVVYNASIGGQNVVVKMMVYTVIRQGVIPADVKGFIIERRIYMEVINGMILNGECGNLVPAVGTRLCDHIPSEVSFLNDLIVNPNNTNRVIALITLVPPFYYGDTLEDYILNNPHIANNANFMKRIMFQMLYTLEACHRNNLIHNDNHLNNWLVGTAFDPTVTMRYRVDSSHTYSMPGNLCVYLFDWDRGYAANVGFNRLLFDRGKDAQYMTLCESAGACNEYRPYRDIFQALCSMSQVLNTLCDSATPLGGVLHDLMRNIEMIQKTKCAGRSDEWSRSTVCHLLPKRPDKKLAQSMPPTLTLLTDPFFDDLLESTTAVHSNTMTFTLSNTTLPIVMNTVQPPRVDGVGWTIGSSTTLPVQI